MQKIIIVLFNLLVILNAVSIPDDGILNITRVAGTSGNFYTVPAALNYNTTTGIAASTITMVVSLYSSQVLLASNCSGFVDYNAVAHEANVTSSTDELTLVNNIIPGNVSTVNLWLDSKNWGLDATNIVYAIDCPAFNSSNTDYTGSGVSGILGLGYNASSLNNYLENVPTLSISLSQDLQNGTLLFGTDVNRTANLNSAVKFSTLANWQVPDISSVSSGEFNAYMTSPSDVALAFDLNTDAIALPETIYKKIIQSFKDFNCTLDSVYLPTCDHTGNLTDLPTIIITVGEAILQIPAEAYVVNAESYNATLGGTITLALKLSNASSSDPHNHVTDGYKKVIVLGAQVFSYYYAVFTGSKNAKNTAGTIELFQADPVPTPPGPNPTPTPTPTPTPSSKWWVVLVILAVVLIGFGIYWFIYRKNKAKRLSRDDDGGLLQA